MGDLVGAVLVGDWAERAAGGDESAPVGPVDESSGNASHLDVGFESGMMMGRST